MNIKIKNITKKYGDFYALKNINLSVKDGEILALLGSSGCGKTTLLRIIAGLIKQDEGSIYLNNTDITNLSAQKRNTTMVFQNYALFPHMTVEENIAYGLKVKKIKNKTIKTKVKETLELVRLDGLEDRKIQELSGGQKQRTALARALVVEPDVLLFDEPLSNLDEKLRLSMRQEIKRIQKKTNITSIYVTHDQKEALAIADKIAVMNKGEICQVGNIREVYYKPDNYFTADFMGHPNIIKRKVEKFETNKKVRLLKEEIAVDTEKEMIYILLRPEDIEITDDGFEGEILNKEIIGSIIRYKVEVDNTLLYVDKLNKFENREYNIGENIKLKYNEKSIHIF